MITIFRDMNAHRIRNTFNVLLQSKELFYILVSTMSGTVGPKTDQVDSYSKLYVTGHQLDPIPHTYENNQDLFRLDLHISVDNRMQAKSTVV